jgi:hypothetical protein
MQMLEVLVRCLKLDRLVLLQGAMTVLLSQLQERLVNARVQQNQAGLSVQCPSQAFNKTWFVPRLP